MIVVVEKRCKLLSFFTIIFAVFFLHDLASAYQISSKRNQSPRQSYDVISISKNLKIAAMELEIHTRSIVQQ